MFEIFIGRIGKVVLLMLVFWAVNLPAQVIGTLTPQSPNLEKTVNFSTPKKIRFKWHEKVVCDQSQYSLASGYYGCAVRLDESEADLNEANWQYDLGYWEDQFNQESVVEADVYVPAGQHTIRWVMFEHELWGNTTSVEVKIEDYAEEEIVMQESLYDWCKVFSEEEVWLSGNLSYLYDKYSSQLNSNGNAYEVRVNRALVSLLRLAENKAVRDVIGEFGFSISDFYLFAFSGEYSGHDKAPLPPEVLNTVTPEALAAIDAALADFNAIPETWTGSIELKPADYPALTESVFIDKAEIAAVKAVLKMMRGFVLFIQGYDCTADYAVIENAWRDNATVENILANMPKAGYVRDMTKLADAKEEFRASLQYLKKVDSAIMNRTDTRTHFLEYDEADARDIQEMRTFIDKAITSLDSETEFDFTYAATQSPLNSSPLVGKEIPNGLVRKIYLGALFSGSLTKDLLPSFEYGGEHGDEDFADFYLDTVPDWTFGGVLPDFTFAEVCEMSENHDWTAVGYMRNNPKMTLENNRRLNIVGKATRDGKIEFVPAVDGWCAVFIDGYWVDDFDCLEGELCVFDDISCGSRYNIEFFPNEPVLTPITPLSLISIPEILPDGGPYVEIVDGIEWLFMVQNGKAYLGSIDECAIDGLVQGALRVPNTLGGRTVIGINEAAFMGCSGLTSVELPATITEIQADAFYRCAALSEIKFLGDEPVSVGEDAFGRVKGSCKIYVTRASDWGVSVPGTWQGLPISYMAGYNPSITVGVSAESGTRFEDSQTVEFTAGANQTVYYTTDGTDPRTSTTRKTYAGAFDLTETTTVTYCAVDNDTGDWSENYTATYSLIVRMPNGGPYTQEVDGIAWMYRVENGLSILEGVDTANMPPDTQLPRQINIPSVLGEHPVVSIFNIGIMFDDVSKMTIPNSVTNIESTAFSASFLPLPKMFDDKTYPGFIAVDDWIVARNMDMMELPSKIDLSTARGIATMTSIADEHTEEILLPLTLKRIIMDFGLSMATNLRRLEIPDSVTSIEGGALPYYDEYNPASCFDELKYPRMVSIDGWIVRAEYVQGQYIDLSAARGICDDVVIVPDEIPDVETLILPRGGLFSNIDASWLKWLYIPDGVTRFAVRFDGCDRLRELFLPRTVVDLGDYSWCNNLSALYVPDSLKVKLESYDSNIGARPIDRLKDNNRTDFNVVYYSTKYYQHTITFDANGGVVAEKSRKVNRGFLPGLLPMPVREGYVFAGWSCYEGRKELIDTTKIVISDMTLYAVWEEVAHQAVLNSDGGVVLTRLGIEPAGTVVLPATIDGNPITSIGRGLMRGATKVTAVTVPSTVTAIEESAFRECSRLETVTLPEGLTTIADNSFRECVSLRSVTIPSTVTNIGYFAFRDCLRLEEVNLLGNPPHRELGVFMGVPAFTTISGRLGSATAIVYASVTNSTPEIAVPEEWLDEIALKHNKPAGSISYQAAFIEKFGDDLSAALLKPTGKKDLHGNTLLVWQDYVAGTDPLDEEDKFVATVSMESGVPVVRWSPELSPADAALRKYTVYGATALDENWVDVSALSDIERHRAGYQFFKVTVEMR